MHFQQAEFGYRVKLLRKERGMTQEQLATRLNISTDHLGKIELGKRGISLDLLLDISEVLDISLDYLLKGTIHTSLQMKVLLGQMQAILAQMENIQSNPY